MKKGYKAEWELFHILWDKGFAVVRVAGSGSSGMPACDLIAGNKKKKFAIEVKVSKNHKKYVSKSQIKELCLFAENFGLVPLVIIKFYRKGWYFYRIKDLEKSLSFYIADIKKGKPLPKL